MAERGAGEFVYIQLPRGTQTSSLLLQVSVFYLQVTNMQRTALGRFTLWWPSA